MEPHTLKYLGAVLPALATDPIAIAAALDRAADAALFFGRTKHAESLARRAAEIREAE